MAGERAARIVVYVALAFVWAGIPYLTIDTHLPDPIWAVIAALCTFAAYVVMGIFLVEHYNG